MRCHLVVFLGSDITHGDVLAVNAGVQPAAAVFPEEAVHRKQHAPGVGACQNTTDSGGVNVDHIVQHWVFRFAGQAEILQKTQPEAVGCCRGVADVHIATVGHHHTQIFFQFLCGKVNHMICPELVNSKHGKTS